MTPVRIGRQRWLVAGSVTGDEGVCQLLKGLGAAGRSVTSTTFGWFHSSRIEELLQVRRHARSSLCRRGEDGIAVNAG